MNDARSIWSLLEKEFGDGIKLRCKKCVPQASSSNDDNGTGCEHEEKGIWVIREDFSGEQTHWTFVREIPPNRTERLCPKKNCQGGKKCGGAHGAEELWIWKELEKHRQHLHTFLPNLLYYEEPNTPASRPAIVKPTKKNRRQHVNYHNRNPVRRQRDYQESKFEKILKKCGRGRFLFACKSCYNLEPRIVKEMEVGNGKDPVIMCKWCNGKERLLFYETRERNEYAVTFCEYQAIRERLSTTIGTKLCRTFLNCSKSDSCTFAHSWLEMQVWKLEANGESRVDLVRHCNGSTNSLGTDTLNGMFHCDRCCLSFADHHEYVKFMGANHTSNHFLEIARNRGEWLFRPVPVAEELTLCTTHECRADSCIYAHGQSELDEWNERVRIGRARSKFRLTEIRNSENFNFEQRPEHIKTEKNALFEVHPDPHTEIKFDVLAQKWKIKITHNKKIRLRKVGFEEHSEYSIRNATGEKFHKVVVDSSFETDNHEFLILFTNPKYYGQHIGDLYFEFVDERGDNLLYYSRFLVNVSGEHFEMAATAINSHDWTKHRFLVKYPNLHQYQSYDEHVKAMKDRYPIPKVIDENTSSHSMTADNYVRRMHTLLYKEEQSRQEILSRLNIRCDIKFGNKLPNGHMLGSFDVPVSVSTDEGILFKRSCEMVLVGNDDDVYAYEAEIRESSSVEEVIIDIAPECVKGLEIAPDSVRTFQVQFQLDRAAFALRHDALDKIGDKVSLICPCLDNYASLQYDLVEAKCGGLDDAQCAVFKHILTQKRREPRNSKINARKPYPPLIVAGPFGTGKTHTIKAILLHLLEKENNDTILLCTHANSSADLYLEDPKFQLWKEKILRLYYHGRDPRAVSSAVQKFCLYDGVVYRYPSIEEIRKYRLIVTTFSTALTLNFETGLSGNLFQYIFLDEASQAMEADVIMPLVLAHAKETRVVLAGDHRQIAEKMYCDDCGHVESLLERMYEAYENVSKRCRILLTNNYRCVEGILSLISKLFYKENILRTASSERCLTGMKPFYFIHLQGECILASNGEFVNESEAYQIAYEVEMIVREREDGTQLAAHKDVVVVSSFNSQVKVLRQVLRRQGLGTIPVHTIQNIQGQEYKVVILSTVMRRTDFIRAGGENFGFLSDPRLLNTALTRAKSMIVVVGDAVTLCSTGACEKYWKAFIKCCEENQTILPPTVNVESVKRQIILARKELNVSAQEFVPRSRRQQAPESEAAIPAQESGEAETGDQEAEEPGKEADGSSYDQDDADSWCSEESLDDLILDDMIKKKTGIDPRKVTVGVGKVGNEFIQYESGGSDNDNDGDPNETDERPSRRKQGKRFAIYPKFTVPQLERMLETGGDEYVRCKIKLENWYTAQAIPILSEKPEIQHLEGTKSKQDDSDNSHECDKASMSSDDHYGLDSDPVPVKSNSESLPAVYYTDNIFIETRVNVGRTFDQDEALVKVIEERRDPSRPNVIKRIGKVLGVLKKRFKNPRHRRFLCCPDEMNSVFMCPIDKKLPRFAILAPQGHKQSKRSDIPIYQAIVKDKKWQDLRLRKKLEKLDENRVYVVRYLKWSEFCPYPLGYVEGSFERGDFRKYLKLEYSVPGEYKKALQRQAQETEIPKPCDDPVIDVFTIDPEGSMDLDDAISFGRCQDHKDCYLIGIHITDVASIVKEGTDIDKEAQKRFSTFYGGDEGPVHMLPSAFGTSKCSILPGETHPAISTFFHSSDEIPAKREQPVSPVKTFIRSVRMMTYGEAAKLLRVGKDEHLLESEEDSKMSKTLYEMWKIMWDWRVARLGGEAYYKNTDKYADLFEECRAHLLIEEAMISVNANTAAFLCTKDIEIPMRTQDVPEETEWTEWDKLHSNLIPNSAYLTSCAKHLKKLKRRDEGEEESEENLSEDEDGVWESAESRKRKRKQKHREISLITASIDPLNEIRIFKTQWNDMLQCIKENDLELFTFIAACDDLHPSLINPVDCYRGIQKKASFKSQKPFHFSLRLKNYAWSSSPIRRYVDILIQRCIHALLDGQPPSEATEEAIKRVCSFHDRRHSEYEEKLERAKVAEYLKSQPLVLEAAVVQITDAFIKIAIPALGKHIMRYARELNYEFLMITGEKKQIAEAIEEEQRKVSPGQTVLTKMVLMWKLRYYRYEKSVIRYGNGNCGKTVKVPIRDWKILVNLISSPPRKADSDYMKQIREEDLMQAVERLRIMAEDSDELEKSDLMTEATRNAPDPIKHKRAIKLSVCPSSTFLLQFSSSHRSRLPEPAVQLLSIAADLDVCVEHMRDPLHVFAQDAEQVKYMEVDSKSLRSYSRKWEPLVRMEAADNAVGEVSSITLQGINIYWNEVKKQKESPQDAFKQTSSSPSRKIKNYFKVCYNFCRERYIDFHQGDLVCLRLKDVPCVEGYSGQNELFMKPQISTHTVVIHAIITGMKTSKDDEKKKPVQNMRIYFEVKGSNLIDEQRKYVEKQEKKWTVELIPLSFPHRSMQTCLLPSVLNNCSELVKSICLGTVNPFSISWGEELEKRIVEKQLKRFKYSLNKQQHEQEQRAIRHDFTIIQGPPGTGKSFLGAQIAAKFAYINKHNGKKQKVLYCGPSNKSVDVAAGFLKDLDLRVVRQYSSGLEEKLYPNPLKPLGASLSADDGKMPDDNLKSVALHELIRKVENPFSCQIVEMDRRISTGSSFSRGEMDRHADNVRKAKEYELERADIIICTCSYSALFSDPNLLQKIKFGQCIIDECAMCSEPETIIPLVSTNPDQIVLIGDHMQLNPVIKCNKAERLGLSVSLFKRYTEYASMLRTQYRMHPNIMDFPSRQFYGGQLICDPSVMKRPKIPDLRISSKSETIFWNVKGTEKVKHFKNAEEGNNSKYNFAEARSVIQLLLRLESYKIPQSQIMVLSPYTAQCARIRELIQTQHGELKNVRVGTVVTSQGSEADYVILSTVRSLPEASIMTNPNIHWLRKNLGFLTDANQINVAITRARRRLFIIGNKALLKVDPLWGELIRTYERHKAVINNLHPSS